MKLHILGNPNLPTSPDRREDYFSYDVYKFIKHLNKYFKMIHYGLPGSKVDCPHFDLPAGNLEAWNQEANRLIGQNKSSGDIILCFYGGDNYAATFGHTDCKIVEAHVGYKTKATFAPFRIFASYAQMHYYYGSTEKLESPEWWDAVIPNAITVDEFDFKAEKEDYVVYLGRIQHDKGVTIAMQAAGRAKKKLIIAGGSKLDLIKMGHKELPKHVKYIGSVNVEERKQLLANARCLIAPTHYIEPFGNIVVEAHLSGTPTITSDWGGFVDTNIQGVTGYRCRLMSDFVNGILMADRIDPGVCRKIAEAKYSDEVVYEQMRQYILKLHKGDWYQEFGAPIAQNDFMKDIIKFSKYYEDSSFLVEDEPEEPLTDEELEEVTKITQDMDWSPIHGCIHKMGQALRDQEEKAAFDKEVFAGMHDEPSWEDVEAQVTKAVGKGLLEEDSLKSHKMYPLTPEEALPHKSLFDRPTSPKKLFTVIIPTMGVLDPIPWILKLGECPLVGEILVIDNSDGKLPSLTNVFLKKIKVIYSGPNIYVNPSWNLGVKEAKFENIILANDDLLLDDITGLLTFISKNLHDRKVIGLNPNQEGPYSLSGGHYIGRGWGRFIAIKKSFYKPIPEELLVWYGDNLLALRNSPYNISGVKGTIGGSASCDLPEIKPIIEDDSANYLEVSARYLKQRNICHIIMSCGRPEYLEKTLQSLDKLDFGCHKVFRILVDDYPKDRDNEWFVKMADAYHVDLLILNDENKGLTKVWSDLWDLVKDMDFNYILHQEDDVILNEEFSLDDWIEIIAFRPDVCSAVLTRQKWYHHETDPKAEPTDKIWNGYRVEFRSEVFSPMMSLYPHYLTREGIKEHYGINLNEGMIMQYLREKGHTCAYIKNPEGKNMITHIGDWFHGKRLLPGEPGYEKFGHYHPDKFYCSKTGKPKE